MCKHLSGKPEYKKLVAFGIILVNGEGVTHRKVTMCWLTSVKSPIYIPYIANFTAKLGVFTIGIEDSAANNVAKDSGFS